MSEERLQKLISRAGLMSRREAENFIVAGRVTVDGKIIKTLGARADVAVNKICVNGRATIKRTLPRNVAGAFG